MTIVPRTGPRSTSSAWMTISLYQAEKSSDCGVTPSRLTQPSVPGGRTRRGQPDHASPPYTRHTGGEVYRTDVSDEPTPETEEAEPRKRSRSFLTELPIL